MSPNLLVFFLFYGLKVMRFDLRILAHDYFIRVEEEALAFGISVDWEEPEERVVVEDAAPVLVIPIIVFLRA